MKLYSKNFPTESGKTIEYFNASKKAEGMQLSFDDGTIISINLAIGQGINILVGKLNPKIELLEPHTNLVGSPS